MIPQSVQNFLNKAQYDVWRKNKTDVISAIKYLNIDQVTEFSEFYLQYEGPFISQRPIAELYDLIIPSSILESVEYVRDRYKLKEKFLPLTSDESEGMYLYNKDNGKVYDFDLVNYQDFVDNLINPRWNSFNEFLEWYFSEDDV